MGKFLLNFVIFYSYLNSVNCYFVELTNDGPVVIGATINFKAELFDNYGQKISPDSLYLFHWVDNAMPPHTGKSTNSGTSYWNASYTKPGKYEVEVSVFIPSMIYDWPITSARQNFNISLMLNGGLELEQDNNTLPRPYVSSALPVKHFVSLKKADSDYLHRNASSVLSYWFVDCVYYGVSDDLSFAFNYKGKTGEEKFVETFVVASHEVPTPPPPTPTVPSNVTEPSSLAPIPTTVTSSDVTSSGNTTTPLPTTAQPTTASVPTSTVSPAKNNTANKNNTDSNSSGDHSKIPDVFKNITLVPGKNYSSDHEFPYVCVNSSIIPPDGKESYGYFNRKLEIRDPVENVSFTGTNWLKQGDMLSLGVNCNGSGPFAKCVQMYRGEYNVTGNETCDNERFLAECKFTILHYFKSAETYTLVIIISNEVSKKITPVAVNIYEVTKHPQLSVIIVPVACSAVAVILIVFGIAYYIQSRNRYTIEVADFDFAQTSDMEYKTFSERLKDAMSNAINRTQDYVEEGNVWSPSRKYGSMQ